VKKEEKVDTEEAEEEVASEEAEEEEEVSEEEEAEVDMVVDTMIEKKEVKENHTTRETIEIMMTEDHQEEIIEIEMTNLMKIDQDTEVVEVDIEVVPIEAEEEDIEVVKKVVTEVEEVDIEVVPIEAEEEVKEEQEEVQEEDIEKENERTRCKVTDRIIKYKFFYFVCINYQWVKC